MTKLLAQNAIKPGTKILVAVSGGADSLALLDLLVRVREELQLQLVAVHINHELRVESAAEEAAVRDYCASHRVELVVRHWPVAQHPDAGIEASAREFRYQCFADVAMQQQCAVVMTAHHRDDQVETVLFRMLRSGDAHSVRGILAERDFHGLRLVRPLLSVTKAELKAYADYTNLPYSEDASNSDVHYSRNYLRHRVLPMLRQEDARADEHIALFATEQAGLVELADVTIRHFLSLLGPKSDEIDWRQVHTSSHAVQTLVLSAALRRMIPDVSAKQVQAILMALEACDGRTRRVRINAETELDVRDLHIALVPAVHRPRNDEAVTFDCVGAVGRVGDLQICLTDKPKAGEHVLTEVASVPVTVRHRQPGDYLTLTDGHHQLLRRWFINMHLPQDERKEVLVAASGAQILWVGTKSGNQLWRVQQTDKIKTLLVLR
ncbi:tRNA lysidine(34) synthetase TilS [Lacticaseibacillus hulanensis]|uniref:tRNA lysidine(34) synthetase TilS n=1 Tax=Lacticaseibacillus hulanensis TaxID=2493111 RepID=UPI000FD9FC48|nr:tRNA lysidine(34) synthetase TilS [Lacticaseibacillus hulanensis]